MHHSLMHNVRIGLNEAEDALKFQLQWKEGMNIS